MITANLLREWGACWDDDRIAETLAGRAGLTPREVADLDAVSLDDRLWVLCHALWHRDEAKARAFAIDSAALISHLAGDERDQAEHARLVADLRRIFALPAAEQSDQLQIWASAWDSAWASAWASAWDSARDSARAWAWASARASAWDSARDSAWASARASANASAWRKAIDRALIALGPDADGWE